MDKVVGILIFVAVAGGAVYLYLRGKGGDAVKGALKRIDVKAKADKEIAKLDAKKDDIKKKAEGKVADIEKKFGMAKEEVKKAEVKVMDFAEGKKDEKK